MIRGLFAGFVLLIIAISFISCSGSGGPVVPSNVKDGRDSSWLPDEYFGDPTVTDLVARKQYVVGEVTVTNDADYLYVHVTVDDPWELGETRVAVSDTVEGLPVTKSGNPKMGHFPYDIDSFIELSQWPEAEELYIAVYAKLQAQGERNETAWGFGTEFPGSNWSMYFTHTIQDDEEPPPPPENEGFALTWGSMGMESGLGIDFDSENNFYVCGYFSQSVDFDPSDGEDIRTSNGSYDACLSKFDYEGNFMNAFTWGGTGKPSQNIRGIFC